MRVANALGRLWGYLSYRLRTAWEKDLSAWVFAISTGVTLVVLLFGGFLNALIEQLLGELLFVFTLLFPLVGVLLVLGVLYSRYTSGLDSEDLFPMTTPEEGSTAANGNVEDSIRRLAVKAASSRYRSVESTAANEIQQHLLEGAIRQVRNHHGHDRQTARELVETGEWTDDPVAAAFLSNERSYPLTEYLRGALDPGSAYLRRVRRTAAVVDAGPDALTAPEPDQTQTEYTAPTPSSTETVSGTETEPTGKPTVEGIEMRNESQLSEVSQ